MDIVLGGMFAWVGEMVVIGEREEFGRFDGSGCGEGCL